KRVELNALRSEELITLIPREILRIERERGIIPFEPTAEDLRSFLSEIGKGDALEEIKKRALYEAFRETTDAGIDTEEIIERVLCKMQERPEGEGHWTSCLRKAIEEYMDDAVKDLVQELKEGKASDVSDDD